MFIIMGSAIGALGFEMKILQLVRAMDMGGLERVVADLSAALGHAGHQVDLACLSHGGVLAEEGVYHSVWEGHLISRRKWLDVIGLFRLCSHISRLRPDIIHSHNPQTLYYATLASFLTRIPFVHTVHGLGGSDPIVERKKARMRRIASRKAYTLVAVSENVRNKLKNVDCVPADQVNVVVNGIDVARYCRSEDSVATRFALGVPGNAFVFGSVGRLVPEKNYSLLLKAFAGIASQKNDAFLIFVGDGVTRPALEAEVNGLGLSDRVLFAGEQKDIRTWLQTLDVFCLSSNTEGLPMALLEASAMGIPSIVTSVGGCAEVIEGGACGLFVPPEDLLGYGEAMQIYYNDRKMLSRFGSAVRERIIKHYSLSSTMDAYIGLYQEAARKT